MGKTMRLNRVGNNGTAPAEGAFEKKKSYRTYVKLQAVCMNGVVS